MIYKICPQTRWTFQSERTSNIVFIKFSAISFCGTNEMFQTQSSAKASSAKFDFLRLQKNPFFSRETKYSNGVSQKLILSRYSISIVIVIEASYKRITKTNYNHGQ